MALREFRDSDGTEWMAWDVPPARDYAVTRSGGDRRRAELPVATERRVVRDRRRMISGAELAGGWLCFQSAGEKRRLAPRPPEWDSAPDDALEGFCRAAKPAQRRG